MNLFGLCEDVNCMKRNSIIDHFALIFCDSLFLLMEFLGCVISMNLMSASCQAPV